MNASSFLAPTTFGAQFVFHLHFCQRLTTLQRGLSVTADLLVHNEKLKYSNPHNISAGYGVCLVTA